MSRNWKSALFNNTKRRRSGRSSRSVHPSRRILFEPLEDRRLLAAQVVDATPVTQTVAFHEDLFLDLNYEVAAPLANAPKLLGLQLHYDSDNLRFVETTNVLQNGLIGVEDLPETVPDSDANTDRTVTFSWLDVVNPWPGTAALPALLGKVKFQALGIEGTTKINFTADTSFGYGFVGEPVTVTITPPTFVVDSLGDTPTSGKTTLREAIATANNNPGAHIVRFAESLTAGGPATITLTEGELLITDALTIAGPGSDLLTIDANEQSRIFSVDDGDGSNATDVEIRGLTLTRGTVSNGDAGDSCGAISSMENLTLSHSIITDNTARLDGGGICNSGGTLTVADSVISNNTALDDAGGIYNQSGVVKLLRSTVSGNLARDDNGGIWNESGTVEIRSSTVSGNISESATGGIRNEDELVVINSTISGNMAAANNGGIISSGGTATFVNSTISNNRGDSDGVGGHVGGGMRGTNNARITVTNTIVAGNFKGTGTDADEIQISSGATFSSGGFNLLSDTGTVSGVFDQPGDQVVPTAADFLGALQNNGGPTETMALLAGSSAINAGDSSMVPFDVDSDQRGRARFFGASVDIGAFEFAPAPGFSVTGPGVTQIEESGMTELSIVLDAPPSRNVEIDITSSDVTEAKPRFASAVFGPNNWNVPQRIPIDGVQDLVVDGDKESTITLAVNALLSDDAFASVANHTMTVTTRDDAAARPLLVQSDVGFAVKFNPAMDVTRLNLYDSQTGALGPADVTVVGESTGPVRGSLVFSQDNQLATFIRTDGPLEPDTYRVVLRSAANGFQSTTGDLLSGATGGEVALTFTVAPRPSDEVTVSVPDFTRGYGQTVNLPNNSSSGIPVTISTGRSVNKVAFDLKYDPALLSPTGFTTTIPGATVASTVPSPGLVRISVSSTTELSSLIGPVELGRLTATVPNTAPYGAKHILQLANITVEAPGSLPRPARADDGIHVAAFVADNNGSQGYSGADVVLLQRQIVGLGTGLTMYPLADPTLLSDLNLSNTVTGGDATLLQRVIVGIPVSQVPSLPSGVPAPVAAGPDPKLFIPQNISALPGETVTVPVMVEVTEANGITLASVDLAIAFDATKFTASNFRLGSLNGDAGFSNPVVNSSPGSLRVTTSSATGTANLPHGTTGSVFLFDLTVNGTAASGTNSLNLLANLSPTTTALSNNDLDELVLIPAPTNADNDSVDGLLTITETVPTATLSIAATDASKNEGDGGSTSFTFTVTRAGSDLSGTSTVNYAVTGSGANPANAADFVGNALPSGSVSFTANETSKVITIPVNGDTTVESDEGFTVTLASPVGGTITTSTAAGTIINDDSPPIVPTVTLAVNNANIAEAGGVATFTATLSAATAVPVTVQLGFSGTATLTSDYTRSGTQIVIPAGQTTGTITVTAVQDALVEGNETVVVDIASVTNGTESGTQQVTTTIIDERIAEFVVTTLDDVVNAGDGQLSLREAIIGTNQQAGADLIVFASFLTDSGAATISITNGDLLITDAVTIQGPGASSLTLDAQGNSRIFDLAATADDVTIEGLTLTGGQTPAGESGGAIRSATSGTLSIVTSAIIGSSAGKDGGGIFSQGGLSLVNSTVAGNTAVNGGGGVTQRETTAQADIIASTISGNDAAFGGGFMNFNATAAIVNSTISGNSSTSLGGGVVNVSDLAGNEAHLLILQSTITQNTTGAGGAVHSGTQRGATFAEIEMGNSLVVQQLAGNNVTLFDQADSSGATVISLGHNLVDGNSIPLNASGDRTDVTGNVIDAVLKDNGGPTKTHALLAGSPAIDAGDSSLLPTHVSTDQRGRTRIVGTSVDVGAFEFGSGSAPGGEVTIPVGETRVTNESGIIFVRNNGNVLFQRSRADVTELHLLGGDGDEILEVSDLGLHNGQAIELFFDGQSGTDTLRLLKTTEAFDLAAFANDDLQNVEVVEITVEGTNALALTLADVQRLSPDQPLRVRQNGDASVNYGTGWQAEVPQVIDGQFLHVLTQENATIHVMNELAWQNPLSALDANRDGIVTPRDALVRINSLNTDGPRTLVIPASIDTSTTFFYFDSNGDGIISSNDVLRVVNFLNDPDRNSEGEALPISFPGAVLGEPSMFAMGDRAAPAERPELMRSALDVVFANIRDTRTAQVARTLNDARTSQAPSRFSRHANRSERAADELFQALALGLCELDEFE